MQMQLQKATLIKKIIFPFLVGWTDGSEAKGHKGPSLCVSALIITIVMTSASLLNTYENNSQHIL